MEELFKQKGFTFVELVVIILLLGIMAAFALPKFFNLNTYQNRSAYDEVAAALRYAQKLAVSSGCEVQVTFAGNSYNLQQHATSCTSGSFTTFSTTSGHPVNSNTLSGVTLSASPSSFIFDPLGRSSSGATISVGSNTITVIAETGYVDAR